MTIFCKGTDIAGIILSAEPPFPVYSFARQYGFEPMKKLILQLLTVAGLLGVTSASAEDKKAEKPKPYTLKTCAVSDEKLGDMGDPFVFTHEGAEVKLCCKSCKKDFDKEPAKFVKKIAAEVKKEEAKKK
jgi:hypothetical protein